MKQTAGNYGRSRITEVAKPIATSTINAGHVDLGLWEAGWGPPRSTVGTLRASRDLGRSRTSHTRLTRVER